MASSQLCNVVMCCSRQSPRLLHHHKYSTRSELSDYKYFQHIVKQGTSGNSESLPASFDESSIVTENESSFLKDVKPAVRPSYNLAAYVRNSELLQNLVKLGINLSKIEQRQDASWILKLDFDKDVKPYLTFFNDLGVPGDRVGWYLTKNINILHEPLEDLHIRVAYFQLKKFDKDVIARIVTKCPRVLCFSTKHVDDQLGFLQKHFQLMGDEVRFVVARQPKLISWPIDYIKDVRFHLNEFMGFSQSELKQLLLAQPKLYLTGYRTLQQRFDYVHNVIGIPHELMLKWPNVLLTRLVVLKPRHLFLQAKSRDQFDPKKENYVSLKALVSGRDIEFCENVAKATVQEYNDFLKSL